MLARTRAEQVDSVSIGSLITRLIHTFMGVLPVTNVGTHQLPLANNVPEDLALHNCSSRQTYGDDGATRSDVVQCLFVTGRAGRGDDRSVRTKAVLSCLLDSRHNVLFFLEVDPRFGAEGLAQFLLFGSGLSRIPVSVR